MSFYTLSSSSGSTIDTEYSDDTPLTSPSPSTHDTSRASYHISDIASFASDLQDAANKAFPNRGRSRYQTVNVCLIRWADDDLLVKEELDRLHDVFSLIYGFNTEIWLIPSNASQIKLTSMTCNFLQQFDAENNLFIVYYGGHGTINNARQNQWWCRAGPKSPIVDWSAIQTLFGTAMSDVLVLLDCCAAASSAPGTGPGVMEAIAACGFEGRAPVPGEYSFTNTLVEVLEEWANKPSFSVAMLHTEVLFILKQMRPERGRDGRRLEWCTTPIHWVSTVNPKATGIEICPLRMVEPASTGLAPEGFEQPTTYVDSMDIDDGAMSNPLSATAVNGSYKVPHVLISVALEENQGNLDAASCRRWLADFPALVKYANVEGVYRGYSTMLTLSLPVMIWDMLPEHPACSFVGYVISPNMYSKMPLTSIPSPLGVEKQGCRACKARSKRHAMRNRSIGVDSSYGSDEDEFHHRYLAIAVRQACLLRGGKNCAINEVGLESDDDSSEREDLMPGRRDGKGSWGRGEERARLEAMQRGDEPVAPVQILVTKGVAGRERYRSPDQRVLERDRGNELRPVLEGKLRTGLRDCIENDSLAVQRSFPAKDQVLTFRKRSKSF